MTEAFDVAPRPPVAVESIKALMTTDVEASAAGEANGEDEQATSMTIAVFDSNPPPWSAEVEVEAAIVGVKVPGVEAVPKPPEAGSELTKSFPTERAAVQSFHACPATDTFWKSCWTFAAF